MIFKYNWIEHSCLYYRIRDIVVELTILQNTNTKQQIKLRSHLFPYCHRLITILVNSNKRNHKQTMPTFQIYQKHNKLNLKSRECKTKSTCIYVSHSPRTQITRTNNELRYLKNEVRIKPIHSIYT